MRPPGSGARPAMARGAPGAAPGWRAAAGALCVSGERVPPSGGGRQPRPGPGRPSRASAGRAGRSRPPPRGFPSPRPASRLCLSPRRLPARRAGCRRRLSPARGSPGAPSGRAGALGLGRGLGRPQAVRGEPCVFCESVSCSSPHPSLAPPAPSPPIDKKYQLLSNEEERCPRTRPRAHRAGTRGEGACGRSAGPCGRGESRGRRPPRAPRRGRPARACCAARGPGQAGVGPGPASRGRRGPRPAANPVSPFPPQRCSGAGCRPPSRPTGSSR